MKFVWWIVVLTYRMHPQLGTSWQLWWSGLSRVCPWGCSVSFHHLGWKNGGYLATTYKSCGMKTLQVRLCGILPKKPPLKKHHHLGKIGFFSHFFAFCCPKNCSLNLEFQLGDNMDRYMELARSPAVSFTRDSLGIYPREHVATGRVPSEFVLQ